MDGLETKLEPTRRAWARRYRRVPSPTPGRLVVTWAHRREEGPDIYTCRGYGVARADGRLMNNAFCSQRARHDLARGVFYDKSIAEELIDRGYDITTLRFSIEKLPATTDASGEQAQQRSGAEGGE